MTLNKDEAASMITAKSAGWTARATTGKSVRMGCLAHTRRTMTATMSPLVSPFCINLDTKDYALDYASKALRDSRRPHPYTLVYTQEGCRKSRRATLRRRRDL